MIKRFFEFQRLGTNLKTEIVAGIVSFATMSYILILNPAILTLAGIPFKAGFLATAIMGAFASIFMGLYAKRPFGLAPYMGECAFVVYTLVLLLGYSITEVMSAFLICGIIFFVLTVFNIRPWFVNSIPQTLKFAFTAGLGLFIAFIGLKTSGIINILDGTLGFGNFKSFEVILALLGCFLIFVLMAKKVKSAILIGILALSFIAFAKGGINLDSGIFSFKGLQLSVLRPDFASVLNARGLIVIFTLLILIFVDTTGTMIAVSYKAGFLNEKGNLPDIKKPMLVDSISTILSSIFMAPTTGVYLESASGVEAGGRSGLAGVIIGLLFLISIPLYPILSAIPSYAYAPALVAVGVSMFSSISNIDFKDITEYLPATFIILFMTFSGDIGLSMVFGFILYPILKVVTGKIKEVSVALWILLVLSLAFVFVCPR